MSNCKVCDTLVSDDGDSDECVVCGAVYHMGRRPVYTYTPAPVKVKAPGGLTFRSRGVTVRSINGFRR